jgi:AraC-like DNA-binding protein
MLRDEAATAAAGSAAVLAKLADVLLTQALRVALSSGTTSVDLLVRRGRDPAVERALDLIRVHPEHPWTIDDLARRVGLSRSTFTAHFRAVTDLSPIQFLTRLRLSLAAERLASSTQTIDSIAHLVGYDNRASLSKAFTRTYGCSPADYRRDTDRAPTVTTH